jgi:hypothetical protein
MVGWLPPSTSSGVRRWRTLLAACLLACGLHMLLLTRVSVVIHDEHHRTAVGDTATLRWRSADLAGLPPGTPTPAPGRTPAGTAPPAPESPLDATCATDALSLPALPVGPVPWLPDLHGAASATTFPQLRALLSNAPPAPPTPDVDALLAAYAVLHAEVMAGTRPRRVFVMEGCGFADGRCGGLGDRVKSLRFCLYVALLSGRALLLQDWYPVSLTAVFSVGEIDWRLPDGVAAELGAAPFVHGMW